MSARQRPLGAGEQGFGCAASCSGARRPGMSDAGACQEQEVQAGSGVEQQRQPEPLADRFDWCDGQRGRAQYPADQRNRRKAAWRAAALVAQQPIIAML